MLAGQIRAEEPARARRPIPGLFSKVRLKMPLARRPGRPHTLNLRLADLTFCGRSLEPTAKDVSLSD